MRYLEYLVAQTDVAFGDRARALRRGEHFRELFENHLGVEIRVQNDRGRDARFGRVKCGQPVAIDFNAAIHKLLFRENGQRKSMSYDLHGPLNLSRGSEGAW